ncbi:hypothetical protein BC938DRAFT_484081 [Jimgerdemannia flammicorona]|uniref:DNA polymerase delta subunit 3 n=2 Tax=Jimgerdemannia flammicorona TaxID=994334 RepID=A0A433R051_9FUNG|nr:hypothetical protein BC938DRAFT_484081 [Jimgerdemannia flammicorona]
MLYEFSTTNTKKDSHATYCLCGFTKDNDQQLVTLVPQEEVEAAKEQFKVITSIHVYSVQPCRPNDVSILVAANHDIPNFDAKDLSRFGVIIHPDFKINDFRRKPPVVAPAPISKTTSKPIEKSTSSGAATQSANPKSVSDLSRSKSKTMSSFFGKAATMTQTKENSDANKVEVSITRTTSTSSKIATMSLSKKTEGAAVAMTNKAKDVDKRVEQELDEEIQGTRSRKRKIVLQESDVSSADDDSDEERDRRLAMSARQAGEVDEGAGRGGGVEEEAEEDEERRNVKVEVEEEQAVIEMDVDGQQSSETMMNAAESEEIYAPSKRRRLKRKVLKKKHHVNARGFMVTEDAWEWESYSEDEPEFPKAVVKQLAAAASTGKGRGKRGGSGPTDQKSLLSFWGKR